MVFNDISDKDIERNLWLIRNKRKIRKIIIIFLVILIFVFFAFSLFKFVLIKTADSKDKNSNWASIDFASVKSMNKASDLIIVSKDIIRTTGGNYDVVATVQNPNERFVAMDLSYKFVYDGKTSDEKHAFILPGESKKLIDFNVQSENVITDFNLEILNVYWKKLKISEIDNLPKDIFLIENQKTNLLNSDSFERNWVEFDVANNSPYNFKESKFYVSLYLGSKIVAVDQIVVKDFYSNEKKHLESSWFYKIPSYATLKVETETNTILPDNYIENR